MRALKSFFFKVGAASRAFRALQKSTTLAQALEVADHWYFQYQAAHCRTHHVDFTSRSAFSRGPLSCLAHSRNLHV